MAARMEMGGVHARNPEPWGCSARSTQTLESCYFNIQLGGLDHTTSSIVLDMLLLLNLKGLPRSF